MKVASGYHGAGPVVFDREGMLVWLGEYAGVRVVEPDGRTGDYPIGWRLWGIYADGVNVLLEEE